ncbi:MAG TPA: Na+/H+ antiporter subunit B [Azospirillaceae bacterium]|nr:Na+/H+ antiporter subunit B [Azospirillaceae bacterium]
MKPSLILATGARLLMSLMLLFSLFILWRGHNEPGGGFIGGLIAATAFALHAAAFGAGALRSLLRVDPRGIIAFGLSLAILSGVPALLQGLPYMTGLWGTFGALKLGTPVLFDIGVYFVVVGGVLTMICALLEEG